MNKNWNINYIIRCNRCKKCYGTKEGKYFFPGQELDIYSNKMQNEGRLKTTDNFYCPECRKAKERISNINVKSLLNLTQKLTGLSEDKILDLLDKDVKIEK